MSVTHIITRHRCDIPMRRSKERCWTPFDKRWRCTGDCTNCLCCIYMDENGNEHHVSYSLGKNPTNIRRGISDDS